MFETKKHNIKYFVAISYIWNALCRGFAPVASVSFHLKMIAARNCEMG